MTAAELVPTIGLEVHMHLKTRTKMFCSCKVDYDSRPNANVCPVCMGMPGVLPVMNFLAVELALRTALALGSTIPDYAKWDRKHYYYPDLPKNYQISEYDQPLGIGGHLDIRTSAGTKRIGITRVHLEEDAGKLIHAEGGGNYSDVDLNRTGTPLLEVVSEPDMNSVEEVHEYCTALRQLAVYLEVSGCNMQLGQMRFEPNISLCTGTDENGEPCYTPIAEIKNLNSFRAVERAVTFEIARHREEYELDPEGYTLEKLGKQTRGYVDADGTTFLQRSKEEAHDYRYFPEPDLAPLVPDRKWVDRIRATIPELPGPRRQRFIDDYDLSDYDARVLTQSRALADYYEETVRLTNLPKPAANWISQGLLREMNARGLSPDEPDAYPLTPEALAEVVKLHNDGTISKQAGDEVLTAMIDEGKAAQQIVEEKGLAQISDTGELDAAVDKVIAENPEPVADFRAGKKKALGRLIGEVMKASKGKANPQVVKSILEKKLSQ